MRFEKSSCKAKAAESFVFIATTEGNGALLSSNGLLNYIYLYMCVYVCKRKRERIGYSLNGGERKTYIMCNL